MLPPLSVVATFLLLEGLLRIPALLGPRDAKAFRETQPPPYQGAPYFSREFIEESFRQPGKWIFPEGTRLILPGDFNGRWFHVKDGIRATAFQPTNFQHRIYVFGGSTMCCSEVPDDLTIASQLQALVNVAMPDRYRVENYGTTMVTIGQQLERLKTLALNPGDVVVFYDGVNDVYQSLLYGNPADTMLEHNRRSLASLNPWQRLLFDLHRKYEHRSRLIAVLLDPFGYSVPPHLSNAADMADLVAGLKTHYATAITNAHAYCAAHGAVFLHCLQPHLFSHGQLSTYERRLKDNVHIVPPGAEAAYRLGYPELAAVMKELPPYIHNFDLSQILDQAAQTQELFLDSCHVNHVGDGIIASNLFTLIQTVIRRDLASQATAPPPTRAR